MGIKGKLIQYWNSIIQHCNADITIQPRTNEIKQASKYAKGRLLDIGCGEKQYKHLFNVKKYEGLDLPETKNKGIADHYGNAMNMPFKNKEFDTVLCIQTLEHIQNPFIVFKEISRVLKKGGYLILTVPQTEGTHGAPNDYFRFTKYGLKYLAEVNGLKIIYIKPTTGSFASAGQIIIFMLWKYLAHGESRTKPSLISKLLILPIVLIIQIIFIILEMLSFHKGDAPRDNIMVAKKIV